ncbi:hypothetical protein OG948_36495 (plasmid) [Embleya sp. NBC_00888]|uniref:hypothetical protein n=1 Tax=Embleya sp. NBC_00888 TaxID=2975960 RepID=UPI002F90E9D1|nr:hypothetical protein OG948_36495 [Embleya sp. NBC_00888]
MAMTAGGVFVGSGTAHAVTYPCADAAVDFAADSHVETWSTNGGTIYCAYTRHTGGSVGTPFGTGVRITDTTTGQTDVQWGTYSYYAGPVYVPRISGHCYQLIGADDHTEASITWCAG